MQKNHWQQQGLQCISNYSEKKKKRKNGRQAKALCKAWELENSPFERFSKESSVGQFVVSIQNWEMAFSGYLFHGWVQAWRKMELSGPWEFSFLIQGPVLRRNSCAPAFKADGGEEREETVKSRGEDRARIS